MKLLKRKLNQNSIFNQLNSLKFKGQIIEEYKQKMLSKKKLAQQIKNKQINQQIKIKQLNQTDGKKLLNTKNINIQTILQKNKNKKSINNTQRQNIITYLDELKQNHSLIEKKLQLSHRTHCKWRNSHLNPLQTIRNSSNLINKKQSIHKSSLIEKKNQNQQFNDDYSNNKNNNENINKNHKQLKDIFNNKQLTAIKTYNHVHNKSNSTLNDQPQIYQFIQQAIHKSIQKNTRLQSFDKISQKSQKHKFISLDKTSYHMSQSRKQIQKLQIWIKDKLQSYKKQQNHQQLMITQRINFIHMAFGQTSRIVGIYCQQTKRILDYIFKQYHQYYSFLTDCMTLQNKKLKKQKQNVEQRLFKTIVHYQEKLQKNIKDNEEKSKRVFQNFHKCIQLKKILENQNKQLKINCLYQKNKLKFMQQGLVKAITLFLNFGEQGLQNIIEKNNQQSLNSNQSNLKQKRKKMLHQWCGFFIRMVHKISLKDENNKKYKNKLHRNNGQNFKNKSFQVVQKYMVQNDINLSQDDAKRILNEFLTSQMNHQTIFDEQQINQNIQQDQNKINNGVVNVNKQIQLVVPTLEQIYKKIGSHNFGVQVYLTHIVKGKDQSSQTKPDTKQSQMMTYPSIKNKCTSTNVQKLFIQSHVYDLFISDVDILNQQKFLRMRRKQKRKPVYHTQTNLLLFKPSQQSPTFGKINEVIKKSVNINLNQFRQNLPKQQQKTYIKIQNQTKEQQNELKIETSLKEVELQSKRSIMSKKLNKSSTHKFISYKQDRQEVNLNIKPNQKKVKKKTSLHHKQKDKSRKKSKTNSINSDKSLNSQGFNQSYEHIKNIGSIKSIHRRDGVRVVKNKKKSILSLRYLAYQDQQYTQNIFQLQQEIFQTKNSINLNLEQNQQFQQQKYLKSKQQKITKFYFNNSIENQKYKTLSQKVQECRSFCHLNNIQFATKQDAQKYKQNKNQMITNHKNIHKNFCNLLKIDSHQLHMELAFKDKQKIKFLSSIFMWNPKFFGDFKKNISKIKLQKMLTQYNKQNIYDMVKGFLASVINPILGDYIKLFAIQKKNKTLIKPEVKSKGKIKSNKNLLQLSYQCLKQSKLTYHNRLCPLIYPVIQLIKQQKKKYSSNIQKNIVALKTLKKQNNKMQIISLLLQQGTVQLDIFVKAFYYFNIKMNNQKQYFEQQPLVSYYIIDSFLIEILDGYFTINQIQKIVKQAKVLLNFVNNNNKDSINLNNIDKDKDKDKDNNKEKEKDKEKDKEKEKDRTSNQLVNKIVQKTQIPFYQLLKMIFHHIKQKKLIHQNKYSIISTILSKGNICTHYQQIVHFLNCLPLQSQKKRKILNKALQLVTYWQKNQPMIPNDILFFLFDHFQLYKDNKQNLKKPLITQYIVNRAELYFKNILNKITDKPEWILQYFYINIGYKIPYTFHKLISQVYQCKDKKQKQIIFAILTLIYSHYQNLKIDSKYMPIVFNGIMAIPNI